ncbi:MAG TPA: four helix bundle protein [Terriglobales bacterium]
MGEAKQSYKDLITWQKAMAFVVQVYRVTDQFPAKELYSLTSQIRRSAISIPSNIAEGKGRLTAGEFKQFLGHARGSTLELETQLMIANELGYIDEATIGRLLAGTSEIGKLINGLLSSLL